MIEMAFRAYDPCNACATHTLPGQVPLVIRLFDSSHTQVGELRRPSPGAAPEPA
jgi:F420-non-reducing hydrogenase large subunit